MCRPDVGACVHLSIYLRPSVSRAYPPSLTSRALSVDLGGKGLTAADLATLGELGSSLPVLESLTIYEVIIEHHTNLDTGLFESLEVLGIDVNATPSADWLALGTTGYDGVHRLAEGLGAGALPTVTRFCLDNVHVSDAGASALAAALSRGALLRSPRKPRAEPRRAQRCGAGGLRAGLAAATRSGAPRSHAEPARR